MAVSFLCLQAERNVLPVLNNLLENREMHLEDGRLLIPAARWEDAMRITIALLVGTLPQTERLSSDTTSCSRSTERRSSIAGSWSA